MQLSDAIRQRILNLLKERSMTINSFANKAELNPSTLRNFIIGINHSITLNKLYKVCLGMGLDLVDFFDDPLFVDVYDEEEVDK